MAEYIHRVRIKKYHKRHATGASLWRNTLYAVLIICISLLIGRISVMWLDIVNKPALSTAELIEQHKERIMDEYKEKHGDNWKEELKKDYASGEFAAGQ